MGGLDISRIKTEVRPSPNLSNVHHPFGLTRRICFLLSSSRTIWVLYAIVLLFNITRESESHQLGMMETMPLPAEKGLWEAQAREYWESEYNLKLSEKRHVQGPGISMYASALNLSRPLQGLKDWYAGVDEFGCMILIITLGVNSLPSQF